MKTTFHVSNYGSFGELLPRDAEGYCHLTIKGWRDAGYSVSESRELAPVAKEAVRKADLALDVWRSK